MIAYQSHNGKMTHVPLWDGVEEQIVGGNSYYVATSDRAFNDLKIVAANRYKPGVVMTMCVTGMNMWYIFAKDEFVPSHVLDEVNA